MKDLILQPHHRSTEEAVKECIKTGCGMFRVSMTLDELERLYPKAEHVEIWETHGIWWIDADTVMRNLKPDDDPKIGFLSGARIIKHSASGWSSITDWLDESTYEIDMDLFGRALSAPPSARPKSSVLAVRLAWGIR